MASNVDLITKTRTEHLSEEDKARHKEVCGFRASRFRLAGSVEPSALDNEDCATNE